MFQQIQIRHNQYYHDYYIKNTTIGVVIKSWLEYKSPFMSSNVHPNMMILALNFLLNTPLYKELILKFISHVIFK